MGRIDRADFVVICCLEPLSMYRSSSPRRACSRMTHHCASASIALALVAQTASAEVTTEPRPAAATEEAHPLRALIELETVLLLGWVYYLTTADLPEQFDVGYRWDTFRRKLIGQSFVFDTNHFGTNFIGHTLGGAGYYLSARSNGAGTLGSSAVAFAGSAIWELFGEVREEISMNDTITTPLAGIAIGETTFQVARFFDRSEGSAFNRGVGLLLGPFTTINDAIDGTAPARVAVGYPTDVWHQVSTRGSLLNVYEQGSDVLPEVELHTEVRLENFTPPRKAMALDVEGFDEGNVTQLRVQTAVSDGGLSRVEVTTQTVLAGINYAAARDLENAEFGYLGLGMGFTYTARSYQRRQEGRLNRLAAVRPLGVATGNHVRRGDLTVDAWLVGGPAFGGVDALGLTTEHLEDPRLPPVARMHGYYMGWGASSEAEVRLGFRDWRTGGTLTADQYRSAHTPGEPVTRIVDSYLQANAYAGYHVPGTNAEVRAFWAMRDRAGTVDRHHTHFREYSTGLQVSATSN